MYQESKLQLRYASNTMIPRRELCKKCCLLLLISSVCGCSRAAHVVVFLQEQSLPSSD